MENEKVCDLVQEGPRLDGGVEQAFKQVRVRPTQLLSLRLFFHAQVKEENREVGQEKKRQKNMDLSAVSGQASSDTWDVS